jgi:hypothetical protein
METIKRRFALALMATLLATLAVSHQDISQSVTAQQIEARFENAAQVVSDCADPARMSSFLPGSFK